jgi:uncharacterized protein
MKNHFVHCELTTNDPKKAQAFYAKVFDWKIKPVPMPGMEYLMVNTGAKNSGGGIQPPPMPDAPTGWMPYVEVASVKQTLTKAKKLGAKIVVPFTDMGSGALGVFVDPTGATLGVYQATKKRAAKR